MSDSDSDCLSPRNLFNFAHGSSIAAPAKGVIKGPNFHSAVNLNFTNASNMPRNFEKHMYDDRYSQSSRYDRREMSPMSMRSVPGYPRGYNQRYYHGGMAHSSMMSSRAVSPTMSMRSMNSNVSYAADNILSALQNMQFSKYELKHIKETCNKLMRGRIHKKMAKRRKLKAFLKNDRRGSGYDSGEQGSDSSISSDDLRSTRTGVTMHQGYRYQDSYRYPQSGMMSDDARSVRSSRTDVTDVRRTIRDTNVYRDCSESFRQNSFKNMFSLGPRNMMSMSQSQSRNHMLMGPPQNRPIPQRKFHNNFMLPSQRFNRSTVMTEENADRYQSRNMRQPLLGSRFDGFKGFPQRTIQEDSDDQEEVINEVTVLEKTIQKTVTEIRSKRNLGENSPISESKRTKLTTPKKTPKKATKKTPKSIKKPEKPVEKPQPSPKKQASKDKEDNDFEFLKPQFPLRAPPNKNEKKNVTHKNTAPDKVTDREEVAPQDKTTESEQQIINTKKSKEKTNEPPKEMNITKDVSETTLQTSDVSLRPSFMKRKLFTQTLDVTETKNGSNDSLSNSPQSVYNDVTKEKNRTRKLVTNSYYLSRDCQNDDNNLLDLIQKIVPLDKMNMTNATQREVNRSSDPTVSSTDKAKPALTSKSAVNLRNTSDSYTDEDIFIVRNKEKLLSKCTVVLDKIDPVKLNVSREKDKTTEVASKTQLCREVEKITAPAVKGKTPKKIEPAKKGAVGHSAAHLAHAFWNCDSESEAETPQRKKAYIANNSTVSKSSPVSTKVRNNTTAVVAAKTTEVAKKTTNRVVDTPPVIKGLAKKIKTVLGASSSINESANTTHTAIKKQNKSISQRIEIVKQKKKQAKAVKQVDLEETLYDVIKKRRARKSLLSTLESSKDDSKVKETPKVNKAKVKQPEFTKVVKTKAEPSKAKVSTKEVKQTKPNKTLNQTMNQKTGKETLMSTKISPIKPVQPKMDQISIDKKTIKSPKTVTAKKLATKSIANKTVNKDLITTMVSRRNSMKQRLSNSTLENSVPPARPVKESQKKDTKPQSIFKAPQTNNKVIVKQTANKAKNAFKEVANGTNTDSDVTLNITKRGRGRPRKDTTIVKTGNKQVTANKENENPEKSFRVRKNTTICACCDDKGQTAKHSTKVCTKTAPSKNKTDQTQTKIDQFAIPKPRVGIDSPMSRSLINEKPKVKRNLKRPGQGDVREWGLGLTKATIGVVPRHCDAENILNSTTMLGDDTKSVTARSIASTSMMTRSRRPKFLHVF